MVVGEAVIVAGIGSRKGVTVDEVLVAIDAALAAHGLTRGDLDLLATARLKENEPAFAAASHVLGFQLVIVDEHALGEASHRTLTHSSLSAAHAGTPSVSEASALAASGPDSRLLGPRVAVGAVTCAIAVSGDAHGR
jgi:cobalt-precorrin 5A hydrolase